MGALFEDLQGSKGYKDKSRRAGRNTKTIRRDPAGVPLDIVTAGGVPADSLPVSVPDVESKLAGWAAAWCEDNMVQDIRKASAQVFRALCTDIGKLYIKPSGILKSGERESVGALPTNCNKYNPAVVIDLYDVFGAFCSRCDKIPFGSDFACFCGCSLAYIREYMQELTSVGFDIAKKTHSGEIDAIRRRTSYFPVGGLAVLNNELYGVGGAASGGGSAVVVESIPTAAGFKEIEQKTLD